MMEATQPSDNSRLFENRSVCVYTSCYCEENVWHLCKNIRKSRPDELKNCFCVFISNEERKIPLWHQKCSENPEGLVVWDYHVIFVQKTADNGSWVYDLDTSLDFPCQFELYATRGIRSCTNLKECFRRCFRVIQADEFLSTFASDRSHMLNDKGEWLQPPPNYPCIQTDNSMNNIQDFISMDASKGAGRVMRLPELYSMFISHTQTV